MHNSLRLLSILCKLNLQDNSREREVVLKLSGFALCIEREVEVQNPLC